MIPHAEFHALRLSRFRPEAEITQLEDWEYKGRIWVEKRSSSSSGFVRPTTRKFSVRWPSTSPSFPGRRRSKCFEPSTSRSGAGWGWRL
jgi:hypothetical protein